MDGMNALSSQGLRGGVRAERGDSGGGPRPPGWAGPAQCRWPGFLFGVGTDPLLGAGSLPNPRGCPWLYSSACTVTLPSASVGLRGESPATCSCTAGSVWGEAELVQLLRAWEAACNRAFMTGYLPLTSGLWVRLPRSPTALWDSVSQRSLQSDRGGWNPGPMAHGL